MSENSIAALQKEMLMKLIVRWAYSFYRYCCINIMIKSALLLLMNMTHRFNRDIVVISIQKL